MEVFDVSMPLFEGMAVYEGDPPFRKRKLSSVEADGVSLSEVSFSLHSGTHVDAPSHYLAGGASVDELPPIIGRAKVLDLSSVEEKIGEDDLLVQGISKGDVVLLKTSNSELIRKKHFSRDFVSLSVGGAAYLVEKRVKAVGIDYFSIESFCSKDWGVHKMLLGNNILIIEGLDLGKVAPGAYAIFCLPLKIVGGEASPVRCVLVRGLRYKKESA